MNPSDPPTRREPAWRSWGPPLFLLAVLVGIPAGSYGWWVWKADHALAAALAETDALDPGWRYEALNARRPPLPDPENAALHALAASKALPMTYHPRWNGLKGRVVTATSAGEWHNWVSNFEASLGELPPHVQLNHQQAGAIEDELAEWGEPLAELRRLSGLDTGRLPDQPRCTLLHEFDGHDYTLPLRTLLRVEIQACCQKGDLPGALRACRAEIVVARATGDEPRDWVIQHRLTARWPICDNVQRTLAQGEASPAQLTVLQELLEKEEAEPLWLRAARWERAYLVALLERVRSPATPRPQRDRLVGRIHAPYTFCGHPQKPRYRKLYEACTPVWKEWEADALRLHNRWVEFAKLPAEEQGPGVANFVRDNAGGHLPPFFQPSVRHGRLYFQTRLQLRVCIAGLAVERYRLDHGRWPATLSALVPGYLSRVPKDLQTGGELAYRRKPDGVLVIASRPPEPGPWGKGDMLAGGDAPGPDWLDGHRLGFRLWDPGQRRQPPRPPLPPPAVGAADDPTAEMPGG